MATANTVFIIFDTAGTPIAAIEPNTLNGPGGVQQNSDLSLFGLGYATWGQASDQNDYRLLENFACPQSTTHPSPIQPMSASELGNGNGINSPVVGQLWFNTTNQTLYIYNTSQAWEAVGVTAVPSTQPTSPAVGQLWYDQSVPQLKIWNGSAWDSVAKLYLPLAGGTMTGPINMGGQNITNANTVSTGTAQAVAYQASNGVTSNQVTIPTSGNTTITDGPRIGPNIIIHTGNIGSVGLFTPGMIMMWNSSVAPSGWAICNGQTVNGHTTPNLTNLFVVAAGGTYALGSTYGSLTPSVSVSSAGAHNHGGADGGVTLNLSQIPAHSHAFWAGGGTTAAGRFGPGSGYAPDWGNFAGYFNVINDGGPYQGVQIIQNSGGGGSHSHSISSDGTHSHTASVTSNLPPCYGLFYIMYVGS